MTVVSGIVAYSKRVSRRLFAALGSPNIFIGGQQTFHRDAPANNSQIKLNTNGFIGPGLYYDGIDFLQGGGTLLGYFRHSSTAFGGGILSFGTRDDGGDVNLWFTIDQDGVAQFNGSAIIIGGILVSGNINQSNGYYNINSDAPSQFYSLCLDTRRTYDQAGYYVTSGCVQSSDGAINFYSFNLTNGATHGFVEVSVNIFNLSTGYQSMFRRTWAVGMNGLGNFVYYDEVDASPIAYNPSADGGGGINVIFNPGANSFSLSVSNPYAHNFNVSFVVKHKFDFGGSYFGGGY